MTWANASKTWNPSSRPRRPASAPPQQTVIAAWELPELFEVFPTRQKIEAKDVPSIKPADLPRVGGLLPAVHVDPLVFTTANVLPTSPATGVIYQYTDTAAPLVIPGYLGRRSTKLTAPGFFAWDGRGFYQVEQIIAGEQVFYPTDFSRELFRIHVNGKQLRTRQAAFARFLVRRRRLQLEHPGALGRGHRHRPAIGQSTKPEQHRGCHVPASVARSQLHAHEHSFLARLRPARRPQDRRFRRYLRRGSRDLRSHGSHANHDDHRQLHRPGPPRPLRHRRPPDRPTRTRRLQRTQGDPHRR